MSLIHRSRFLLVLVRELSLKYKRALIFGLFLGCVVVLGIGRLTPWVRTNFFQPIKRIGIVGEFTPINLPLALQQKISFGLTNLNADGSVLQGLAESWEATDSGKIFIFHLATDQTWHNGKSVTAEDVNYNIRNVRFTVLSKYLIRAELDNPYAHFPELVSKPLFQAGLRGFGPYRVAGLQLKGDKIQFLKLVPLDRKQMIYEYRFYRTEGAAITAYKLGEIDDLEEITEPQDLAKWRQTNLKTFVKYNRMVTLFFNLNNTYLKEKSLRQALAYALPKIDEVRAFSPISQDSWAYFDKVRHYDPDLVAADKLLKSSKIEPGSLKITISTFTPYFDLAQKIAGAWTGFGIKTEVKLENSLPADYQVLLSAQDLPPDPDQYAFWHSTQTHTNITGYSNVKIDKLLEDGRKELDLEQRKKIYQDFQRRLVEDVPAIFLYYPKVYTLERK